MTHRNTVLAHLRRHGHLTCREAFGVYGITRLAARVHELRIAGYRIFTEVRRDVFGAPYTRYEMARTAQAVS